MNETGREQDIRYMEQLEQITAERDRLRNENAEYLAMLDADSHRLTMAQATIDRLRVWLREISDLDPKNLYSGYDAVRLAKSALQEDNDEIHRTMVRE